MLKSKVQKKFKKQKIINPILLLGYWGVPLNFELGTLALFCHLPLWGTCPETPIGVEGDFEI
jgi:hypothetical protein